MSGYQQQGFINRDLISTGQKVIEGGHKGAIATNGSEEEKVAKRQEYQTFVDILHFDHPMWSFSQIKKAAATQFGVSESTIKRHCSNPKNDKK